MICKIAILCAIFTCSTLADKDDKKWVWGDNNRNEPSQSKASARYEVFEDYDIPNRPGNFLPNNQRPNNGFINQQKPLYNNRPAYGNQRPHGRPEIDGEDYFTNERPGGIYGSGPQGGPGGYGQGHNNQHYPEEGVLTGPIPSWQKQGPIKDFDHCKCAEKFNCNSPGISYGHCDVGKQYCCFSTKKSGQLGGPIPSRPIHSPENGVLVGPGGPFDGPNPGGNHYPRPGRFPGIGGAQNRPGGYGGRPQGPIHSPENGVLVGPGGPFDRPNRPGGFGGGYGGYERSAKN